MAAWRRGIVDGDADLPRGALPARTRPRLARSRARPASQDNDDGRRISARPTSLRTTRASAGSRPRPQTTSGTRTRSRACRSHGSSQPRRSASANPDLPRKETGHEAHVGTRLGPRGCRSRGDRRLRRVDEAERSSPCDEGVRGLPRRRRRVLHDHVVEHPRDQARDEGRLCLGGRFRRRHAGQRPRPRRAGQQHRVRACRARSLRRSPAWSRSRAGPGGSATSVPDRSRSRARRSRPVPGTGPTTSPHPTTSKAAPTRVRTSLLLTAAPLRRPRRRPIERCRAGSAGRLAMWR